MKYKLYYFHEYSLFTVFNDLLIKRQTIKIKKLYFTYVKIHKCCLVDKREKTAEEFRRLVQSEKVALTNKNGKYQALPKLRRFHSRQNRPSHVS